MNRAISYNIHEACIVSKSDLRNYVMNRLNVIDPDSRDKVTKRLLSKSLVYLEGYSSRLKEEMTPPVIVKDIQTFLLSEGFKYIWKKIEER